MKGSIHVLATVAIVLAATEASRACQVCIPFPKKSIADHLLECDAAVLAREDPKRPFHFSAIEVLKGDAPEAPFDLFLNSGTRRILAAYPDRSVLLVKIGTWRRIATVDARLLTIVRDVLKWQRPGDARYDYFARLLGHERREIRDLAHLEVARAPYSYIRKLGRGYSRKKIAAALSNPRYAEWWALHILLLAQSDDARDKRRIRDAVHSAERFGSTLQLGAWAAAFIEIEGADAIEFLESRYFRKPRHEEELREVVAALSVFGGTDRLRDRIVASYTVLLERHPAMAVRIVDDLFAWRRWEMAAAVRRIAERTKLAPKDKQKLLWFAAMADRGRKPQ